MLGSVSFRFLRQTQGHRSPSSYMQFTDNHHSHRDRQWKWEMRAMGRRGRRISIYASHVFSLIMLLLHYNQSCFVRILENAS
jgi:hypothetical protein